MKLYSYQEELLNYIKNNPTINPYINIRCTGKSKYDNNIKPNKVESKKAYFIIDEYLY